MTKFQPRVLFPLDKKVQQNLPPLNGWAIVAKYDGQFRRIRKARIRRARIRKAPLSQEIAAAKSIVSTFSVAE
jgi:hypothetical protein